MGHGHDERSQFQIASEALRQRASMGHLSPDDRNLRVMIVELVERVEKLTARIPLQSAAPKPGVAVDVLEAEWAEAAVFRLLGQSEQDLSIEAANFIGDVRVRHPQLDLRAQQLALAFDAVVVPNAARGKKGGEGKSKQQQPAPSLRTLVATERVQCVMIDPRNARQTVLCDRLELRTALAADGRLFPQTVEATGKVRATDEKQELLAGAITLTLAPSAPTAAPAQATAVASAGGGAGLGGTGTAAVELREMRARQDVTIRSADGATARGDEMIVTVHAADKSEARLVGKPARVEDKAGNALAGGEIRVFPESGKAQIVGPGTIDAVQRDGKDPKAPGRAVRVTWRDGAVVDGPNDKIDVTGDVVATLPDRDGTVNTARGQRVTIALVKKPVPATRPAATAAIMKRADAGQPSSPRTAAAGAKPRSADKGARAVAGRVEMDFFKDKEVGSIALTGGAVVNSNQADAAGTVLREFQLQAPSIAFDVIARRMTVPTGGQMLVRDHRPAAAPQPRQPAAAPGAGKGATAFQWSKSLVYDEANRRATMSGGVVVAHKPDGADQPPVRLTADDVTADFLPSEPKVATTKPAAGGPAGNPPAAAALQLKGLSAVGNITITRGGAEVRAARIAYDPTGEWLIATGTPRNPAAFSDGTGAGTTTAEEVQWNTRTWHLKVTKMTARVR